MSDWRDWIAGAITDELSRAHNALKAALEQVERADLRPQAEGVSQYLGRAYEGVWHASIWVASDKRAELRYLAGEIAALREKVRAGGDGRVLFFPDDLNRLRWALRQAEAELIGVVGENGG